VTDAGADGQGGLEVQDIFTASLDELRSTYRAALPAHFGPVVGQLA
jgi:phosphoribosylformylglycinamidine synthase